MRGGEEKPPSLPEPAAAPLVPFHAEAKHSRFTIFSPLGPPAHTSLSQVTSGLPVGAAVREVLAVGETANTLAEHAQQSRPPPPLAPGQPSSLPLFCSPGHHGFHGNPHTSKGNEGDWRGGGGVKAGLTSPSRPHLCSAS